MSETTAPLTTEEMVINLGPQHPSTHGVLRFVLTLQGETIVKCVPHIGYLHSSLEKIAETLRYEQFITDTDRFDYLNGLGNELCYVQAVEKLAGIEPPPRTQFIRTLMVELKRISSHLVYLGTYGNDVGATTVFLYAFREREVLLDMLEAVTGGRLLYNYMRIGGLRNDLPTGFDEQVYSFLEHFPARLEEMDDLLTRNRIFIARTRNVGVITADQALSFGVTGPTLRGCGVPYDIRKLRPYAAYDQVEFDVPTFPEGDCLARHLVRMEEMRQSMRIIRQVLEKMPEGEIQAEVPRRIKPEPGEVYERVESPRGELGCYLLSDGGAKPYRMHWRGPSFYNLQIISEMVRGGLVADFIASLGSIDTIAADIDR